MWQPLAARRLFDTVACIFLHIYTVVVHAPDTPLIVYPKHDIHLWSQIHPLTHPLTHHSPAHVFRSHPQRGGDRSRHQRATPTAQLPHSAARPHLERGVVFLCLSVPVRGTGPVCAQPPRRYRAVRHTAVAPCSKCPLGNMFAFFCFRRKCSAGYHACSQPLTRPGTTRRGCLTHSGGGAMGPWRRICQ